MKFKFKSIEIDFTYANIDRDDIMDLEESDLMDDEILKGIDG